MDHGTLSNKKIVFAHGGKINWTWEGDELKMHVNVHYDHSTWMHTQQILQNLLFLT